MEDLKKIVVDASSGISYEIPLTVGEIAQLDRDRKEAKEFFKKISNKEESLNIIKNKLLNKENLTQEEISLLFGE